MNINPEQIPQGVVDLAVETFLSNTGQAHTVTELQRELTAKCIRPALAAALPVLLGEPVAWRTWIDARGWQYTVNPHPDDVGPVWEPLYTLPTQDTANADQ